MDFENGAPPPFDADWRDGLSSESRPAPEPSPQGPRLLWFGDEEPDPPPWLVKDLLPQAEVAFIAGQWGAGKTFIGIDLAACVMLGVPFAGREVVRHGGVLWLAAEGATHVASRIKAAATERNGGCEPDGLPFARQAFDVPRLTAPESEDQLVSLAEEFKAGLARRFPERELVLIVIDTMGSAAGWQDGNNPSEAQTVMDKLRRLNRRTGALVLVVDHYGKSVEAGIMGASSKGQSADAILAVLSERDVSGNHSNRRMSNAKARSGASGGETTFTLRPVPIDEEGNSTCVVDWGAISQPGDAPPAKGKGDRSGWTAKFKLFRSCIGRIMGDQARPVRPFGSTGPEVQAVPLDRVRDEFLASYAAPSPDAKTKQWARLLRDAVGAELITTRQLANDPPGDWLWVTGTNADPAA